MSVVEGGADSLSREPMSGNDLQAGGLVVGTDAFFRDRLEQLAALSVRYAVPTVYQFREFAAVGGLIGYGGSLAEAFRGTGVYSGRILKGDKPGDLPVQQVTKLELYINLKTAKALGWGTQLAPQIASVLVEALE
jgi:putative ABC transport system substrate-binding protein